ncbi:MAG TPA: ABC transporter substrate-binding protein [Acidimicrobiales bacterium]|nr:ABC transporter substrate-binding protein [Acidimicrobiales bacterium]
MTVGPTDAPGFSIPSIPVGAQQAIDEINAAGGINGRQVELITCNDQNDPNVAAQCGKQAVDEGVVALVGGLSLFDLNILPALQQAGIPWVGLTSSDSFDQDGVYLFGGDGASAFTGIGGALAKEGCKNVAILLSASAAPANGPQIQAGVEAGGAKVVTTLNAPATGADWAPTVEAARKSGADCIASGAGPPETGPLITAINAGPPIQMATADGGLPDVVLAQLGSAADGVIAVSGYLPASSDQGIVKQLGATLKEKHPEVPYDQFAKSGYASVKVVEQATKGLDEITPASVTKGLSGVVDFDTGLGPVIDLSTPSTIPGYERIFSPMIYEYVAKNGVYELLHPDPMDMTPALKLLSEGK